MGRKEGRADAAGDMDIVRGNVISDAGFEGYGGGYRCRFLDR